MTIREYKQDEGSAVVAFDSAIDRWVIEEGLANNGWEPFGIDLEDVLQWVAENHPYMLTKFTNKMIIIED